MAAPYYAPYYRPMQGYYNASIPQDNAAMQNVQQYQYAQAPAMPPMSAPSTSEMLWVLNETEAISYPVAPNNSVTLWDKNKDTVYIKSVNMQGIPSIRILDYAERTAENAVKPPEKHECACTGKYVPLEDFNALKKDFNLLRNELISIKAMNAPITSEEVKDGE